MSIKTRLAVSNILMILVPVCITVLIALGCLVFIWAAAVHGTGLGFEEKEDFFQASKGFTKIVSEALEGTPQAQKAHLEQLSKVLDESAVSLLILQDGAEFYSYGSLFPADRLLLEAAAVMGETGAIANEERSLYACQVATESGPYQVYLFSSQHEFSYHTLKMVIAITGVVLLLAIFGSVFLTNRFLIRFVFRKIEEPLNILANGVQEIGAGNLEYRIRYAGKDEFAPICAEFNQMAVRLKRSVAESQQHEESRKELMASISHDLRSPLTSIQAYVEGLLDGVANTPEKQRAYLQTVKKKAEEIQRMVSQIFLYSKMELADFPLHIKVLRLDQEMLDFLQGAAPEYAAKGLLIATLSLEPVMAKVDQELLRRLLTNILDNSVKYKQGDVATLRIDLFQQEDTCLLTLTDDGPGVPDAALPKLFDVFYRSDPARQNPNQGSGLGLAIAAKAVSRMGGTIRAQNAIPHGLSILITLPKESETDAAHPNH